MKPHIPQKLPIKLTNWEHLASLIEKASISLGRLDTAVNRVINPLVILSPLMKKEAVLSSKIEWTQATLEEVLEYEVDKSWYFTNKGDIREVLNYYDAIQEASEIVNKYWFVARLFKSINGTLLQGWVRGNTTNLWNYRQYQVHIWPPWATIEQASYIPPPPQMIDEYIKDFEQYCNSDEQNKLVQTAVMHAQFEIIHPFSDWNWRTWRILIPIFLNFRKVLRTPIFYISEFFEENRWTYYHALQSISKTGNWDAWVQFFLWGVIAQAEKNCSRVERIYDLHCDLEKEIPKIKATKYSKDLSDFIISHPFFSLTDLSTSLWISASNAHPLITPLVERGLIQVARKGAWRKPTLYIVKSLIDAMN